MVNGETVHRRALALIAEDGRGVARKLSHEFGLTRQAVSRHLIALEADGLVKAEGSTRARVYRLVPLTSAGRTYRREGLYEDVVWREVFRPVMAGLPERVMDIWRSGVTEMVNNAVDHSGSATVTVGVRRNAVYTFGMVQDEGEGIFLKIQRAFNLYDPREATLELAKGKLTTDPVNHTGEGIFFTSRAFDYFVIRSGNLSFWHDKHPLDLQWERPEGTAGTMVNMWLGNESPRTLKSVFDEFSEPEEYTFAKTVVPVRLAQYEGEKLVSRLQAKRLSMRFERFRHVILDFAEVVEIGQAFTDELFRVFAQAHPQVALAAANMTPEVERMVQRAKNDAGEAPG